MPKVKPEFLIVLVAGLGFAAGLIAGAFERDPPEIDGDGAEVLSYLTDQPTIVFGGCSGDQDNPITCTWTATLANPNAKTSKCIYGIESGAVVRCEGIKMLPPTIPATLTAGPQTRKADQECVGWTAPIEDCKP